MCPSKIAQTPPSLGDFAYGGRSVGWTDMFSFLPSLPGFLDRTDDVRALVNRVDTARHQGIPNGCVLEFSLRSVPPEASGFDPLAIITGGGRPDVYKRQVHR